MNATVHMGTSRRSGLRAKDLAMLLELAPERWLGALVQLNHLPHYGHRLNVIVLAHDLAEILTERDREQAAGRHGSGSSPRSTGSSGKIALRSKR